MSEADAIVASSQISLGKSLPDQILNSPNTSDPCHEIIDSSTSIDELNDKLSIIENANKGQHIDVSQSIIRIQTMIQNGDSLDKIKSSFNH